jgi:thymidylate kinase
MTRLDFFGLDGHDGAGKTTLAVALAQRLGGTYRRPFGSDTGHRLMEAAHANDSAGVLAVGHAAIRDALDSADNYPVILDRSWLTVASLAPDDLFRNSWVLWVPTVLCWADLPTTIRRLGQRNEEPADPTWHCRYLRRYREIADEYECPLVETHIRSTESSLAALTEYFDDWVST